MQVKSNQRRSVFVFFVSNAPVVGLLRRSVSTIHALCSLGGGAFPQTSLPLKRQTAMPLSISEQEGPFQLQGRAQQGQAIVRSRLGRREAL